MLASQRKRYLDKGIEVVGYLDIETMTDSFKADNGYIISWVLKQYNLKSRKSETFYMCLDKNTLKSHNKKNSTFYDADLLPELVRTMKECDLIVTHYGTWFDIPFIRTRCQIQKMDFIHHEDKVRFADTWKIARVLGSYKSNSLDNVARTLGVRLHKTKVDYAHWRRSVFGDRISLKYILKHNIIDVEVLEQVFKKIESTAPISARYY
ncbi:MAG: ribonuclease H-like domain-containing protein [Bacteroidetes bacterium]|nr:ribonuclease H-like domain-containing protein [Bacteroidota bacterium]